MFDVKEETSVNILTLVLSSTLLFVKEEKTSKIKSQVRIVVKKKYHP